MNGVQDAGEETISAQGWEASGQWTDGDSNFVSETTATMAGSSADVTHHADVTVISSRLGDGGEAMAIANALYPPIHSTEYIPIWPEGEAGVGGLIYYEGEYSAQAESTLTAAISMIDEYENGLWAGHYIETGQDEDEFYEEGAIAFLIDEEIHTRNMEPRTFNMTVGADNTDQVLWMFNENMNWRLDYLGRYILSQKKKIHLNRKLLLIRQQYASVEITLEASLQHFSVAKVEAENAHEGNSASLVTMTALIEDWGTYQDTLRADIVTIQGDFHTSIQQVTMVRDQYAGYANYYASLRYSEVVVQCQKVKETYDILVWKLQEIAAILIQIEADVITRTETFASWETEIAGWQARWVSGNSNLFTQAQGVLETMF